jgi:uncharacterized delta-60 repeat protein
MNDDKESTRASGGIDPSFGNKGVFVVPHPSVPGRSLFPTMVVTEPMASGELGKIYVGCDENSDGTGRKYLVRLSTEGRLDVEFGNAGYCMLPELGPRNNFFEFLSLVFNAKESITGFGRIYESTASGGYTYPAAFRITHDGVLDTSFNKDGFNIYRLPVPSNARPAKDHAPHEQGLKSSAALDGSELSGGIRFKSGGVMPQADGKILFLANVYTSNLDFICSYVARLQVDGSLDTSFGDQGTVLVTDGSGSSSALVDCWASAVDTLGRIVVVGSVGVRGVVARFDAEGRLDQSFGEGGRVQIVIAQKTCVVRGVVAIDEKLIVLCAFLGAPGVQSAALIQLLRDGNRDPAFNGGQPAIADLSPSAYVGYDVTIDQVSRLVIGGARLRIEGSQFYFTSVMSRFKPLGMLDPTFGLNGHSVNEDFVVFRSVDIQGTAKIVTLTQDVRLGDMLVVARFIG